MTFRLDFRFMLATSLALVACGGAAAPVTGPVPASAPPVRTDSAAIARARTDSIRLPWTAADVRFMTLMIGHHAQAVEIAGWVPTHGGSAELRRLAERIVNGQEDEIRTMRQWLLDRRQPLPEIHPAGHAMPAHAGHGGMPGMLGPAQLDSLNRARGTAFDRLFLTYMIRHHEGAVSMVRELFATDGAGQDETVFKFANDVQVDQITEIARMEKMLALLPRTP